MRMGMLAAGVALLLHAASAGAQIYKWVDSKGVTHYSDTPPAGANKAVTKAAAGPGAQAAVALPYELARAVRAAPVTLFTTKQCGACDQGRALLKARGIPFTEKTVATSEDLAVLGEAGSNGELPLLLVGRSHLAGFQQDQWQRALTAAAYPARSMLPARYRHPEPEAAAPATAPVQATAAAPAPESSDLAAREAARAAAAAREKAARARRKTDTPPGFQF